MAKDGSPADDRRLLVMRPFGIGTEELGRFSRLALQHVAAVARERGIHIAVLLLVFEIDDPRAVDDEVAATRLAGRHTEREQAE